METEQKETVLSLDSPLQAVLLSLDKGISSPTWGQLLVSMLKEGEP